MENHVSAVSRVPAAIAAVSSRLDAARSAMRAVLDSPGPQGATVREIGQIAGRLSMALDLLDLEDVHVVEHTYTVDRLSGGAK